MYVENEYKCGNCEYSENTNDSWRIYCNYYHAYYDATDSCSHHERVNKSEGTQAGCFITTMVCEKLGLADDCTVLEVLRGFRNNIMQKDCKYKDMLFEYDTVGPEIARCISEDEAGVSIAQGFYNMYIEPTARYVASHEYDKAVEKYKKMTNILRNYYGIEVKNTDSNDYDYTQGGHGKVRKLGEYPIK